MQSTNDMSDEKKQAFTHAESLSIHSVEEAKNFKQTPAITVEEREWLASLDIKEQNRIFHKVDVRLVPMLALLYLIAHLDRANIGNAKIE